MKKWMILILMGCVLVLFNSNNSFAANDVRDFDQDGDVDAVDLEFFVEKYGSVLWFKDADMDGFSDGTSQYSNEQPDFYFPPNILIQTSGDCDDNDDTIHPNALEICDDELDNNCDGAIDMDDISCIPPCIDNDNDGFGIGDGCLGFDCDDEDPDVNPDADEICNDDIDNDCDGTIDINDSDCESFCLDEDLDGYGQGNGCLGPDCDYHDSNIYPGAEELCDGKDNDCDKIIDEEIPPRNCTNQEGVCSGAVVYCTSGQFPECGTEEYQSHAPSYQNTETLCDDLDNDCDGQIDEGCN